MLHVKALEYLGQYTLKLEFGLGEWRTIDLQPHLWGQVFEPLKETALFAQAQVDAEAETVVWPNGADFAPEFLYQHSQPCPQ
jgi:hypothetical protein